MPGQGRGKAAVPFTYDQPGSTGAAGQAKEDMRAVGFAYGDQAETAGAGDGAADAGDAAPNAEAAGTDASAGVPTVQLQPFVPRFEVPEDLRDSLPETERMHKVRPPAHVTVRSGIASGTESCSRIAAALHTQHMPAWRTPHIAAQLTNVSDNIASCLPSTCD